jgi:hypothetical protein
VVEPIAELLKVLVVDALPKVRRDEFVGTSADFCECDAE